MQTNFDFADDSFEQMLHYKPNINRRLRKEIKQNLTLSD